MGSKRTYTVKEIKRLQRAAADLENPIAGGGSVLLETGAHPLEGPEHTFRSGALLVRNVISPAQLVANTDNWNPTDLATADAIRVSTDASRNLTGIAAPSSGFQAIVLANVGAFNLVLKHDVTSTAANRLYCPNDADMTLQKDSTALLVYDATSTRWRVIGGGGGGGGGGVTFGTPAIVLGTAAADGSTDEAIRRDSTIVAFDATAPSTQAFADAAAAGAAAVAARRDHKHAMMANPVTAHEAASDPHTGYALDTDLSTHAAASDPHTGYVKESEFAAKGDVLVGTGSAALDNLAVGSEGQAPVARAAESVGIKWEDRTGVLIITIDGQGLVPGTGIKAHFPVPYNLTFTGWEMAGNVAGAAKIDLWADTFANFPPDNSDSITNAHEPEITATNQTASDTSITDWSGESRTSHDWMIVNLDSIATITRLVLAVYYRKD